MSNRDMAELVRLQERILLGGGSAAAAAAAALPDLRPHLELKSVVVDLEPGKALT